MSLEGLAMETREIEIGAETHVDPEVGRGEGHDLEAETQGTEIGGGREAENGEDQDREIEIGRGNDIRTVTGAEIKTGIAARIAIEAGIATQKGSA